MVNINNYTKSKLTIIIPHFSEYLCINSWTIRSYAYSIKGLLEKEFYKISFFDFLDKKEGEEALLKKNKFQNNKANIFCIITFFGNRINSLELIKKLKAMQQNCKIILAGPFGSIFYEKILKDYPVDVIILQDQEFSLLNLLSYPLEAEFFKKTNNIAFLSNGSVFKTSIKLNNDLDKLPFVSIDFVKNKHFPVPVTTARGCCFRCKYCDKKKIWGDKVRFRSIENVLKEIEILHRDFNCRKIWFDDANFIIKKERTIRLCKELIKSNFKINWSCSTRVDSVDRELLKLMNIAGCKTVYYGVESGSRKILKEIGKKYSQKQIIKAVKLAKSIGIRVGLFLTIGNPGENKATLSETKKLLIQLYPFDELNINPLIVLPGTELYYKFLSSRKMSENYFLENSRIPFYNSKWQELKDEIVPMEKFFEICPINTI